MTTVFWLIVAARTRTQVSDAPLEHKPRVGHQGAGVAPIPAPPTRPSRPGGGTDEYLRALGRYVDPRNPARWIRANRIRFANGRTKQRPRRKNRRAGRESFRRSG